jgi:type VI protein secretion system component VasK
MIKRSGKVQFLFWLFVLAWILYAWIVWLVGQTFLFSDAPVLELPAERVAAIFILYGLLALCTLAGTVVSIFIANKRYTNRFGALFLIIFITFLAGKSLFG